MASAGTPKDSSSKATRADRAEAAETPGSVVEEIKAQHRQVEAVLSKAEGDTDISGLLAELKAAWLPHTIIEEEIILPALLEAGADEALLQEAEVRRDVAKLILAALSRSSADDAARKGQFIVLSESLTNLIQLEERPSSGVLAQAESKSVDLEALRQRIDTRRREIQSDLEGASSYALEPSALVGTTYQAEESSTMATSNTRERDEYGRFVSDDDRRGSRSRSSERGRDDYRRDDYRSERNYYSRGDDDDYDRRRGGREDDRGWYGDSERHSEAARRGWESREGAGYSSRSSSDYDDDRRGGGRDRDEGGRFASEGRRYSRYDDDDRGDGRGWYGDSEGHSEAAHRGWDRREGGGRDDRDRDERGRFASDDRRSRYDDDDDRYSGRGEGRGWYGDPEGHAEAARRGWDTREGGGRSRSSRDYDDDRRGGGRDRDERGRFAADDRGSSRSSSRRDDDDRDRRGSRGGWFGDSRGHSEAARRGWEDRR